MLIAKPFAFVCTSKSFVKSKNHSINGDDNFPFKRLNALHCLSFHLNEPSFFKKSGSSFANAKKSFMNFMLKLANPRNDLTPFVETMLYHSLIDSIFLGSGLTPSQDNTCPKKSISGLANLFFAQLAYSLFSLSFCNTNSRCVTCSFANLEYTKMSYI